MNTYYFNDEIFKNTNTYQNFINDNPKIGYLKIRASAANSALPIPNVKIIISKIIDNSNVIFYEGYTDSSGMIEKISLPAPTLDLNNMIKPSNTIYDITATYDEKEEYFNARMYEGVCVIQDIIIVPSMKVGDFNGS
ncbi:MAG: hypothetical protein IJ105_05305 [Bacilli bacterium]|nr:hypothetical protein [Bacilli bacterium]